MKFLFFSAALLLVPLSAGAFLYSGQIVDDITGEGLMAAEIASQSNEKTKTDQNGFFQLDCQNAKVKIRVPGYQEKFATLTPKDNKIKLTITGMYEITAVNVKAKPDAKKVIVSKQSVQKESVKKTTVAMFPDVSRVVQMLPGVTSNGDMSALLYVRGGEPDEVISLLDDMIIMNPYLWGGRMSIFNPNLVDSVDFFAGGFPAEGVQAMSAYLVVKNRVGNPDKFTGFVDLSSATADVVLEGPCPGPAGSSFLFGFRRTYYDLAANATTKPEDNQTYPYFYDSQLKLNFPYADGTLSAESLFSFEGMNLAPGKLENNDGYGSEHAKDTRFKYFYRKHNTSISYDYRFSKDISVMTLFGLRNETMDMTATDFYMPSNISGNQYYLQLRHTWQFLIADCHILKTGVYGISGNADFDLNMTTKIPTLTGYYSDSWNTHWQARWPMFAGGFVQDDIELVQETLYLNPGVNLQYMSIDRQWITNPRVALKYKFTPDFEMHAATGLYSQHPTEFNILDQEKGNPNLLAKEAIHYVLGTKVDAGDGISIQLETYYKDYRRLFVSDANPAINYTNNGLGYAYGADIIVQKKISEKWDGWLTYSYLAARRKISERSNPQDFGQNPTLEPLDTWYQADSDRPHTFNLVLNYTIHRDWKIALTQKYMTGKPYTPILGADYQAAIGEYIPQYGEYNHERFPDYASTDLKLSMPFFWFSGWSAYLQVSNLLDVKNVEQYAYKKDYSDKRPVYQMPRMFIGGVRWEF